MYTHTHNAKYIAVSKREKEGLVENKKTNLAECRTN